MSVGGVVRFRVPVHYSKQVHSVNAVSVVQCIVVVYIQQQLFTSHF